jgi:hypothetical protein
VQNPEVASTSSDGFIIKLIRKMVSFKRNKQKRSDIEEESAVAAETCEEQPPSSNYVELGTIRYVNLTKDLKHGEYNTAVSLAKSTGKPIFANFVEWSG